MKKSMMPKGVEHIKAIVAFTATPIVKKSMMPKGVEHCNFSRVKRSGSSEEIYDAERR